VRGASRKSTFAGCRASRSPRNASTVRSAVEHVFATQKHRMDLFIRTIGIERAKAKIGLANIAFNFKRFLYWEYRPSTA